MPSSQEKKTPADRGAVNPAGRSYGGETSSARDDRRRRQLLDAGLEVFGTVGFRGATVRGLCRRARVADRYFYELFPTIEDLLIAVYDECIARLMAAVVSEMTELPDDSEPEVLARRGLDAFFAVTEDPLLARVVWLEVLGISDRVDQDYLATLNRFGDLIRSQVQALATTTTDAELDVLITSAVGGIRHTGTTWLLDGYRTDRSVLVNGSTRFLIAILDSVR